MINSIVQNTVIKLDPVTKLNYILYKTQDMLAVKLEILQLKDNEINIVNPTISYFLNHKELGDFFIKWNRVLEKESVILELNKDLQEMLDKYKSNTTFLKQFTDKEILAMK